MRAPSDVCSVLRYHFDACCAAALPPTDILSPSPKLGLDALYVVLAAVLGINAWNERKVILGKEAGPGKEGAAEESGSDGQSR